MYTCFFYFFFITFWLFLEQILGPAFMLWYSWPWLPSRKCGAPSIKINEVRLPWSTAVISFPRSSEQQLFKKCINVRGGKLWKSISPKKKPWNAWSTQSIRGFPGFPYTNYTFWKGGTTTRTWIEPEPWLCFRFQRSTRNLFDAGSWLIERWGWLRLKLDQAPEKIPESHKRIEKSSLKLPPRWVLLKIWSSFQPIHSSLTSFTPPKIPAVGSVRVRARHGTAAWHDVASHLRGPGALKLFKWKASQEYIGNVHRNCHLFCS